MKRIYKAVALVVLQGMLYAPQLFQTSYAQLDHSVYIEYAAANTPIEVRSMVTPKKKQVISKPKTLPPSFALPVQFYAQAPFGDWGDPYQNACEEMSLLLTKAFLERSWLTAEQVDAEVLKLTDYVANQGYQKSMNMLSLQDIAKTYWGMDSRVLSYPTEADIKGAIAAGYPVIVPLAGQQLGNPHFTGLGPEYHVLVISGYTETEFITQEVGTNFGENYRYSIQTILSNLHDYAGEGQPIESGVPRAVVLLAT